jgi:hypothetical protein
MSNAEELADLTCDEDELDFSNASERAVAVGLIRVRLSRKGHRGWWMTAAITQAENVIAAALGPPVVQTQLMVNRLLEAEQLLDELFEEHQRLLMLHDTQAQQEEMMEDLNPRYDLIQTRINVAMQASAVPDVVPANPGAGSGAGAVTKLVEPLKPFLLSAKHNPTETADWFVRFRGYYQASRMELSTINAQRLYMQSCIDPKLWLVVKQHLQVEVVYFSKNNFSKNSKNDI